MPSTQVAPTLRHGLACTVLGLLLHGAPVIAQPASSEWQRVEMLRPGTAITVILKDGDRIEAPLIATTATALRLRIRNGGEMSIPKAHVRVVTRRDRN